MLIGAATSLIVRLVTRFLVSEYNSTGSVWRRVLERDEFDPLALCALGGFAIMAFLHALQVVVSRGGVRRRVLLLVIAWNALCFTTLLFEILGLTSRVGATSWMGVTRSPGQIALVQQKTAKAVLLIIAPGLTLTLYEDCAAIGMGLSSRAVSKGIAPRVFSPFVVGCSVLTGCLWVCAHLVISAADRIVVKGTAIPLLIVAYVMTLGVVYPGLRTFANSHFRTPTLPYLQAQFMIMLVATDILDYLCLTTPELLPFVMACFHIILLTYSVAWAAILSYSSAVGDEAARLRAEKDRIEADLDAHKTLVHAKEATEVARQRFMRYVFHEVRVPFNSIDMGLGLLVDEESENMSPEGKATLELLLRASASMKVIINDTLDWAKVESGAFQCFFGPTKVRDLVQGTVLSLTPFAGDPETRVRLDLRVDPRIPTWLLADKVRLQQVLANLVSNAVKFSPHDGSGVVTIQVTAVPDAPELCDEAGVLHLPSTAMQRDMVVDLQGTYWRNGSSMQVMNSVSNATVVTDTGESGVLAGVGSVGAALLSALSSRGGAGFPGSGQQIIKAIAAQKERRPSHYAVIDVGENVGSGQSGSSFIRGLGQDAHEHAQAGGGGGRSGPQRAGGAEVGKEGFSITAALVKARVRAASACAAVSRRTKRMRGNLFRGFSCAQHGSAEGDGTYTQQPPSDSFVVPPPRRAPGYGPSATPSPTSLVHVARAHAPSTTVGGTSPLDAHGASSPVPMPSLGPSPSTSVGGKPVGRPRSTTAAASIRFFSSPVAAGLATTATPTLPASKQHGLGHSLGQGNAPSALSHASQHVGQGQGLGSAHASSALGLSYGKAGEGTTYTTGGGSTSGNGGRIHTCNEAECSCPIGYLKAHAVDNAEALSLGRCIGCVPPLCALVAPASILQTLDSTSHSFAKPTPPEGAEGEQGTSPQNATQRAETVREPLYSSAGAAAAIALDITPSVLSLSGDPNENLDLSAVPHCTLLISVRDNGEGIPAADIPMLFQAFRQLDAGLQYKGKGTGLGLAICHEIITKHGGRVGVRSTGVQGQGAEFMVALRLPILTSAGMSAHTNRAESTSEAAHSARSNTMSSAGGGQAAGSASHGSSSSSSSGPGSSTGGSQSPTLRMKTVLEGEGVPAVNAAGLPGHVTARGQGMQESATEALPKATNVQAPSRHKGLKSQRRLSWHPSSSCSVDTTPCDVPGSLTTTSQKGTQAVSHDTVTTTGAARPRKLRTDGSVLTLDTGALPGVSHIASLAARDGDTGLPGSAVQHLTLPPAALRSALKQPMPVPHDAIVAHMSQPVESVREVQRMEEELLLPGGVPSPTACAHAQAQVPENDEEEDLYMAVGKVQKRGKAHLRPVDAFSSAWTSATTGPPAVELGVGRQSGLSSIASAVVSTHNSYSPSSNSRGNSNDSRGKERKGSAHATPREAYRAAASEPTEEHHSTHHQQHHSITLQSGQGAVSRPRTAGAQPGPVQVEVAHAQAQGLECSSSIAQKGSLNGLSRHFTFHPAGVHDDESVGAAVHDALARRAAAMVHAAQAARTPHHVPRHLGPWGDPLSPAAAPAGTRDSAMSRAPRDSTDGTCSSARGPLTQASPPLGPGTGPGTPSSQHTVAPSSAEAAAPETSSKVSPAFPGAPTLSMPVRSPGFSHGSGWLPAAAASMSPAQLQQDTAQSSPAKQASLSPGANPSVGLHVPLQRSASMRIPVPLGDAARVRSMSSRQLLPSHLGLSTIQENPQPAALLVPTVSPLPPVSAALQTEAAVTEVPAGQVQAQAVPVGKRPLRILVVDDVSDNRKLLTRSLRARLKAYAKKEAAAASSLPLDIEGVELREASDGHEAVAAVLDVEAAWVETAAKAGDCLDPRITSWPHSVPIDIASLHSFDVITMDAEMPTMSGFVATRLLRLAGFTGAIFGCTGNALEEDQRLFCSAGVNSIFIKPVAVAELAAAIVAACARAQ